MKDLIQHACATGWRTHKDVERTAARAKIVYQLIGTHLDRLLDMRLEAAANILEEGGMSGATVNRHVAAFLSAYRIARRSGLIQADAPTTIEFPWRREGKGRDRVPTRQEVAAILRALPREDAELAWFLYRTGCRLGEALRLRWEDYEGYADQAWFRLKTSKSGHPRNIVLTRRMYGWVHHKVKSGRVHVLDRLYAREGLVFEIPPSTFSAHWRAARQAAGLGDWFVPHSLRHARATEMVRAGVPLPTVAKALGHESIKTTMRYTHPSEQDVAEALER